MKLENTKKVSKNVIRIDNEFWHYYFRISKTKPKITGKYLFFSEHKEELERLAIEELENNEFSHAKINTDEHKKGRNMCFACIILMALESKN